MNQEVNFSLTDVRPLGDRLLLLRMPDRSQSTSLIVPETAKTVSHRGKVERIGPGKYMGGWVRPVTVPLGAVVQYQSCDVDDGTHVLIQEGDVLFIEE